MPLPLPPFTHRAEPAFLLGSVVAAEEDEAAVLHGGEGGVGAAGGVEEDGREERGGDEAAAGVGLEHAGEDVGVEGGEGGGFEGETQRVVFVRAEEPPEGTVELAAPMTDIPEGFWPVAVEIGISDNYNVELLSGVEEDTEVYMGKASSESEMGMMF